ncbi:hypothetical protein F4808DRAFT_476541 [Astrocystis sublimbata]|nr:hypothetical protein F4808DRAFT_476541 [Astrocystis sublimbata]
MLSLLEEFEATAYPDREYYEFRDGRDNLLRFIALGIKSMPLSLQFMLDHGGDINSDDHFESVALLAHQVPNYLNMIAGLRWQCDNPTPARLNCTTEQVTSCAMDDRNYAMTRTLYMELFQRKCISGQKLLLAHAIAGGLQSRNSRNFLINNVQRDALGGVAWRVAIDRRDLDTATLILQTQLRRGGGIHVLNQPMEEDHTDPPTLGGLRLPGYTPLDFALCSRNYFEAAEFLTLGADATQVKVELRWQVLDLARVRGAPYLDYEGLARLVFNKGNGWFEGILDPFGRAQESVDLVIERLVNDLANPLPEFSADMDRVPSGLWPNDVLERLAAVGVGPLAVPPGVNTTAAVSAPESWSERIRWLPKQLVSPRWRHPQIAGNS